MGSRWHTVVVDARDPARLARWWAEVLSYKIVYESGADVVIAQDAETYPQLLFGQGDDPKPVKNRLHLDLVPDDQDAEVERLVDMGARHVDIGQKDVPWTVLADPEGNEFCVLKPRPM